MKFTNLRDSYYQVVRISGYGVPHVLGWYCTIGAAKQRARKDKLKCDYECNYLIRKFNLKESCV